MNDKQENKIPGTPGEENKVDPNENYLEQLIRLKQESVPRKDYDKVMADNKKLVEDYVNGQQQQVKVEEPKPVDMDKLRKDLFYGENSNLEYCQKSLQLREEVIKRGERDPFLPVGKNNIPTEEDIREANNLANCLQHCIEVADGDDGIFTAELMRITVDNVSPLYHRNKN